MTTTENAEELRSKVAEALYQAAIADARKHAAQHDMQLDRLRRVFETARLESDRSAAVLIFALIEDLMLECLKGNLRGEVRGGWAALTDAGGLLSTATDRLQILELLSWIRRDTCDELRRLKDIRNRFAHHADVQAFEDQRIRGWISALDPIEGRALKEISPHLDEQKFTARELFFIRAAAAVAHLSIDLSFGPAAFALRLHPRVVAGPSFDEAPENAKEVLRWAADVMLLFFPQTESDGEP